MSSDTSPPRDRDDRERGRLERIVPELVKKLVEAGVEKLADGPESLRQLLSDLKLPREAIVLLATQLDETKKDVTRVLARELREFLERASLADELTKLLSGLTLEVKTQVRFVPNATPAGRPKPEVRTKVGVHIDSEPPIDETGLPLDSSNQNAASGRQPSRSQTPEETVAEQERTK